MTTLENSPSTPPARTDATNRYLEGDRAPVAEEITAFDLSVTGNLPDELSGRWLRNGPNPINDVDEPGKHHWFSGDGMVHGVRLRGGKAEWYRNRWVRADDVADALGEPRPEGPSFGNRTASGPNTNVGGFAGTTWAMVEGGGTPVELSYDLDTIGRNDFNGTLPAAFSAHPKYDPSTGDLHAMTYCWPDLMDHIQYVVVGQDPTTKVAAVTKVVDIPVPGMPMVHDISITPNWAVVFDLAVTISGEAFNRGINVPFGWNPDHPTRIGLLSRHAEDASGIIWCEVDPCATFHPLNAFEDAQGRVVIDFCRYERMFDNDMLGPFGDSMPTLDRWTIDPATRHVHEERIDDRAHEFPRHDPRVGLKEHQFGYTAEVHPDGPMLHGSTFKTDYRSGTVAEHSWGQGRGGAEPIFIPRDGSTAEDDGWLMVLVHDHTTATPGAELCVLDARDMAADPVARIHLPQRVPIGFHGNWVPD